MSENLRQNYNVNNGYFGCIRAEGFIIFDHKFCSYITVGALSFGFRKSTHD